MTFEKTIEIESMCKANLVKLEAAIGVGEEEMNTDLGKLMEYKKELQMARIVKKQKELINGNP